MKEIYDLCGGKFYNGGESIIFYEYI